MGWALFAVAWAGLLAYGFHAQYAYATTAGRVGRTPQRWPAASKLPRDAPLMFVHAECPCTRASLRELARLDTPATLVVAPATLAGWEASPAAAIAKSIRKLRVVHDDGTEAARFGAETSGYLVSYDADGALRFAGGITAARGEEGDSVALAALRRQLQAAVSSQMHPVYGCPLESP